MSTQRQRPRLRAGSALKWTMTCWRSTCLTGARIMFCQLCVIMLFRRVIRRGLNPSRGSSVGTIVLLWRMTFVSRISSVLENYGLCRRCYLIAPVCQLWVILITRVVLKWFLKVRVGLHLFILKTVIITIIKIMDGTTWKYYSTAFTSVLSSDLKVRTTMYSIIVSTTWRFTAQHIWLRKFS